MVTAPFLMVYHCSVDRNGSPGPAVDTAPDTTPGTAPEPAADPAVDGEAAAERRLRG
ncbi:hypothetical protein KACC15558_25430 [Brevibacterium ammoniilyticum]|uniref:Uncharacterized protein n=1 Tax=Brevibacterium ammoniilyticum TaxID=1046555 RepID=A0ABP9U3S2_9MICO